MRSKKLKIGQLVLVPMYGKRPKNLGRIISIDNEKIRVLVLDGINKIFPFKIFEVKPYRTSGQTENRTA